MKNILSALLIFGITALSCSKEKEEESNNNNNNTSSKGTLTYNGANYTLVGGFVEGGDMVDTDVYLYTAIFYSEGVVIDNNGDPSANSTGSYILFDLYSSSDVDIPARTYSYSANPTVGNFDFGLVADLINGDFGNTELEIVSGILVVDDAGNGETEITGTFEDENGNNVNLSYKGVVDFL